MSKDERILKKVGKLLKLYGVSDEEKEKFLADLQDKKYDDQEELNETEEVEEESPTEEVGEEEVSEEVSEDAEEPGETEPTEEVESLPEEPVEEQPSEEPVEEVPSEQPPMEEPLEEQQVEQPVEEVPPEQPNEQNAEFQKALDGVIERLASLEDIVKKLGAPVEESVGVEPHNPSGESLQESEMDRINRLRMGR